MSDTNSTFVKDNETLFTRLSPPSSRVAFGLRSAGRIVLDPGQRTPQRVTDFVHIIWSIAGTGTARIDDIDYLFPPEHTAAFPPGVTHCLTAGNDTWHYRWITLDGPAAEIVVSALGLGTQPVPSGPCPDALFDELEKAVLAIDPESEHRATIPAYRLLVEAACHQSRQFPEPRWTRWADTIRRLIAENLDDPAVGVTQIAEIAGMDRTTLTYRFRAACGVPPKEYIMALRLQRAMALLRTTEDSVAEIATACGFSCANYFIKAFAGRIGTTPLRYRHQGV